MRHAGRVSYPGLLLVLAGMLAVLTLWASSSGAYPTSWPTVAKVVWQAVAGGENVSSNSSSDVPKNSNDDQDKKTQAGDAAISDVTRHVILDVRLCRVICAILAGAILSAAGVLAQGSLLNPLAEPYTLGVSAGAAFGAAIGLTFSTTLAGMTGVAALGAVPVAVWAFGGGALALGTVLMLASFQGRLTTVNLVLAGVIVSAILSAGIGFLKFLADERATLIVFWLMGSFASAGWQQVWWLIAALTGCLGVGLWLARPLDILALGEQTACSLGVPATRVRLMALLAGSLAASVTVAAAGMIAFAGLILPHVMRFLLGPAHGRLLIASALGGGVLLLLADTASRTVLPVEVPVGILTSLIGGPFFCVVFRSRAMRTGGGS